MLLIYNKLNIKYLIYTSHIINIILMKILFYINYYNLRYFIELFLDITTMFT